jgi:hypothetical protein
MFNKYTSLSRPAEHQQHSCARQRDGNNKKVYAPGGWVQNFKYTRAADVKAARGMLLINHVRRPVTAHQPNSKIN